MANGRSWLSKWLSWRVLAALAVWLGSLAAAGLAGAYGYARRADILAYLASPERTQIVNTNLYNLAVRSLPVPAEGRDGGIDPLGEGILFANRLGRTWYVDLDLTVRELGLRVPINFDEFDADPFNAETILKDQFAVKDLLVQPRREGIRLLASYNYWYSDEDCYSVRVAGLETSVEAVLGNEEGLSDRWKIVYETPCGELTEGPGGVRNPTLGSGGRLVALSDHEILVTIGGFGPEIMEPGASRSQNRGNPFGKTLRLDLATGDSRIFTIGHRNPQGLAVSSAGEIWLTEHAERGGDELNRLVEGANYGFPLVSYGTNYESMVWVNNPRQGRHDGFERPMYAWVPSVGISQVKVIEGPLFEHWRGDVLVSALGSRTLYRVRIEEDRVIFVEPIEVIHRIRDVTEAADGTIVLKTDNNLLVFLRPVDATDLASLDAPTRGSLLAAGCSGCHALERDTPAGIGPNLWGVAGRRVASREDYGYSAALGALGGTWTPELLRRFLADPDGVAPGTTMQMTRTYSDAEIGDLIAYLQTLR
jgi:cytochrome c2